MEQRRLVLDVSTLARWTGPAVGMMRVEFELAKAAAGRGSGACTFLFYDPRTRTYHEISPDWTDTLLGWHGAIDTWGVDYPVARAGWRRWVPSRYPVMRALERYRLLSRSGPAARAIDLLQGAILGARSHTFPFKDAKGRRISLVPADLALGAECILDADTTLVAAASDWLHKDLDGIAAMKRKLGFRLVALCYDLLPLTHPDCFPASDVEAFRAYWTKMLAIAEKVVVNSRAVRDDVVAFCAAHNLPPPEIVTIPLGCDRVVLAEARAPLRIGLERERFALFVSTIEPRKNHAMLIRVWRGLLEQGIPQRHRFKLVFVGRRGWMVDALLSEIHDRSFLGGTLLHFDGVDDDELDTLYSEAAFCVYPSLSEGFGLPVIESFARGKAVIASSGGSLAEVAGDLAPSLDPSDEAAWAAQIQAWIEDPDARRAAERRVAAGFAHHPWSEIAQRMLDEAA